MKRLIIKAGEVQSSRHDLEVIGAFNPAVCRFGKQIYMLLRVAERPTGSTEQSCLVPFYKDGKIETKEISRDDENYDFSDKRIIKNGVCTYLTSVSHLRLAVSEDGINFTVSKNPLIVPQTEYEEYGIEDPRITKIGNTYYITYSAVSRYGINGALISTKDFITFKRHGIIFTADNKDCTLYPRRIKGRYYALHRPSLSHFGRLDIWGASSKNLVDWGGHQLVLRARADSFDNHRLGAGAPPVLIDEGFLEIYHYADKQHRYCLAAAVTDKNDPFKVLYRSGAPLVEPIEPYETRGFFGAVVFACGALLEDDRLMLYYGASDQDTAMVTLSLSEVRANLVKEAL